MDIEKFVKEVKEINQKRAEKMEEVKAEVDKTLKTLEEIELQKEMDEDIRRERDAEGRETKYDCWLSDNILDLRKDFIEEKYEQEFDDYCKQEYRDSD
jgi:hypothetical protein